MKNSVSRKELAQRFSLSIVYEDNKRDSEFVTEQFFALANWANYALPEGRDKALALTRLEEAMMWAHSALTKREEDND